MQTITATARWVASDAAAEDALLRWTADRAAADARHLAPVASVGRTAEGVLAVEVTRPMGTPLPEALDVLGTLTTGVAVTLTVPLLELVVLDRGGALVLGSGGTEDVLVDDAGAVVFCDRPLGAVAPGCGPGPPSVHTSDGSSALLLAARTVWDRTDPREQVVPAVVAAVSRAVHGDVDAARCALDAVRAAAAPRPVRWRPPADDLLVVDPPPSDAGASVISLGAVLRDLAEHGVPVGDRRVPLRTVLVGAVVAAGLCTAGVLAVG